MTSYRIPLFAIAASTVAILSACGGGSSSATADATKLLSTTNFFLAGLDTTSGLTSPTASDLYDAKYLDMGVKKADVLAALSANAQALPANAELSLFPGGQLSNATFTNCDSDAVCTMMATLTNSDVDVTTVDITTKVKIVSGVLYLYGDQSATSSI
ncbi:MAG: hypothetical protein H7327_04040 [Herminiimonas sp.]|nr:hypothetical protein [Herminiimonas sp.]